MKPSQLVLKPSRRLAYLLLLVSVAAGVVLLCIPISYLFKLALPLLITLGSAYSIAADALLALPRSTILLTLDKENDIVLTQKNGKSFVVTILPTSLVMPQLTVLNLRFKGQYLPRSVVILADSADCRQARLWRVWLKWGLKP